MKISFLHTLASNQALFAPYADSLVATCLPVPVVVNHHVREQLLVDARQADSCPTKLDQVSTSVHITLKEIIQNDQPDMVLCTCSTIGGMAESYGALSTSGGCRVLRVDRPMAEQALQYANIVVLAALESTIQPTLDLLLQTAESKAAASSGHSTPEKKDKDITTCVVPHAWDCFQRGDLPGYAHTIADFILETYSNHNDDNESTTVIVLAQASMSPAKDLVEQRKKQPETSSPTVRVPRILTSPDICIQYLADKILSRTQQE